MLLRMLSIIALLVLPFTFADVEFLLPAPGDTVPAGEIYTITWQDSGKAPLISSLAGYQIFLMVGGNTLATSQQVATIPAAIQGSMTAGNSITFTVPASAGPPDPNAYFLQITSAPTSGTGTVVNFSQRFTLSGMTGQWPSPAIEAAYTALAGSVTAVPPTDNTINAAPAAGAPGAAPGAAEFSVSYQFQTTGLTKYAPMQPKPGSTITATNTAPLFPPSLFTVATTFLPIPSIVTTITQAITYSTSSMENTASPAAMPSDDMQKFLNRWKD